MAKQKKINGRVYNKAALSKAIPGNIYMIQFRYCNIIEATFSRKHQDSFKQWKFYFKKTIDDREICVMFDYGCTTLWEIAKPVKTKRIIKQT